ncbi:MAG: riboflavin kinase [Candidatus Peregrinibacteria bacterium]
MKFFRRKVIKGTQLGRKLGFPTVNLHVGHFGEHVRQGVHVCEVIVHGDPYSGLLYFGPKFAHPGLALEIYIHHFSKTLYGQWVSFKVGHFIRAPKKFTSVQVLKSQMRKDIRALDLA